jgi:hypothetical protein
MTVKYTNDIGGEVEAPRGAHLALQLADGEVLAIPVGATMFIIEDPLRPEKIFPVILAAVHHNKLTFFAHSLNSKSTRRIDFVASVKGQFLSSQRDQQRATEKARERVRDQDDQDPGDKLPGDE